jgi:outer membrane protein with beta-barrel domain
MNTRKLWVGLIFILLSLPLIRINAQSTIGIRAGVISSKFNVQNGDIAEDYESKLGADIALVADFPIGIFSFSPEFHWLQKGAKLKDLDGSFSDATRTFNYLEIPVLAKLTFGDKIGFFFMAGPSVGYLLNGSDKDMDGQTNDLDLDFYKRLEYGLHVGGGIELGMIRLDLRYIYGLSNVFDDDTEVEIKNTSLGAGISLIF